MELFSSTRPTWDAGLTSWSSHYPIQCCGCGWVEIDETFSGMTFGWGHSPWRCTFMVLLLNLGACLVVVPFVGSTWGNDCIRLEQYNFHTLSVPIRAPHYLQLMRVRDQRDREYPRECATKAFTNIIGTLIFWLPVQFSRLRFVAHLDAYPLKQLGISWDDCVPSRI